MARSSVGWLIVVSSTLAAHAACDGDPRGPKVSITAPADGATVSGIIPVTAAVRGDVVQVDFSIDSIPLCRAREASVYGCAWDTTFRPDGRRAISAVATDRAGNRVASSLVTVTVGNGPLYAWTTAFWPRDILTSIWGTGAADVRAVGLGGIVVHWNGSAWSEVPSGTTNALLSIWGSGTDDFWAAGTAGLILHWDGAAWSPVADQTGASSGFPLWGSGPDDVWTMGVTTGPTTVRFLHWDGRAWSIVPGAESLAGITCIWGSGRGDVWAGGAVASGGLGDRSGRLLHWDGAAWSVLPVPGPRQPVPAALWGSGPGDVWAAQLDDTISHWDGRAWAVVPSTTFFSDNRAIWGSGPDDIWAAGDRGALQHWDGTSWTRVNAYWDTYDFVGLWASGPDDFWLVGYARFTGGPIILHLGSQAPPSR